jgi:hypothetical protein
MLVTSTFPGGSRSIMELFSLLVIMVDTYLTAKHTYIELDILPFIKSMEINSTQKYYFFRGILFSLIFSSFCPEVSPALWP